MKHLYAYDGNQVIHFVGEIDQVSDNVTYFVPEDYADVIRCSCYEGFVVGDTVWFSEPDYIKAIDSIIRTKRFKMFTAANLDGFSLISMDISNLERLKALSFKNSQK